MGIRQISGSITGIKNRVVEKERISGDISKRSDGLLREEAFPP